LGEYEKAADAYNRALADPSPSPSVDRALVQMKLTYLPQVVVAEADDAEAPAEDSVAEDEAAEESAEETAPEEGDSE
jgi:hypothetical protein